MAHSYAAGNTIRLLVSFTSAGTPYNPVTVTCQVIGPASEAIQTLSPVNDSTGNYHADIVVTDPGPWEYRWSATGPVTAAEAQFTVRASQFVA
jgi:hypothetical protein